MKQYMYYFLSLFLVSVMVSDALCRQKNPTHSPMYRIVSNKTAFDRLVGSKKYALVLFYEHDSQNKQLTPQEQAVYTRSTSMLKRISEDDTYSSIKDLVFVEVNVAIKDGEEIFNRYSSAPSLPSFVVLIDGKEATDWGQTYGLAGNITEQDVVRVLEHVLQKEHMLQKP